MDDESEKPSESHETLPENNTGAPPERTTQTTQKRSFDYWAGIGKLSTIVAIVGGAIAIYSWLYPRGPRVTATCTSSQVSEYLRYGRDDAMNELLGYINAETVEIAMPPSAGKAARSQDVLQAFTAKLKDRLYGEYRLYSRLGPFSPSDPIQALRCTLVNDGTEPASEVALNLPYEIVRAFINQKTVSLKESDLKSVSLGDLPAGPSMQVEVWAA